MLQFPCVSLWCFDRYNIQKGNAFFDYVLVVKEPSHSLEANVKDNKRISMKTGYKKICYSHNKVVQKLSFLVLHQTTPLGSHINMQFCFGLQLIEVLFICQAVSDNSGRCEQVYAEA